MKNIWLLIILGLLTGCISEAPSKRLGDTSDSNSSDGNDDGSDASSSAISFYRNGYFQSLTIDSNLNDVIYMRGSAIQNFLADDDLYSSKYCILINFRDLIVSGSAVNLQLRGRAVPISFNNFSSGTAEKLFRLEFQDKSTNQASCQGNIALDNPNSSVPTTFTNATAKYLITELCPDCLGLINSDEVYLYNTDGTNITSRVEYSSVSSSFLNLENLTLLINSNNNTTDPNSSCSSNACQAQGFDCCSDGQCVNDGSQKSGIDTSSSSFLAALQEVLVQPSAYTNYPEYFNICSGGSAPTGDTDDGDPDVEAQERLQELLTDKDCIDELVLDSATDPYTLNYLSFGSYPATIDPTKCSYTSTDFMYIQTVLERLYNKCGCSQTTFSDKINNCPAYKYKISETDASGNPLAVVCDVPTVDTGPQPFQDLDVNVMSRSVPHRFFKRVGGDPVDDLSKYFLDTSFTYEGDDFSYLDGLNRMIPINADFSMNSILGAFDTKLDKALPAKMIDVDKGTAYLIETRSGFYQTCVNCARDTWLNSFTAYPTSTSGVGLKAIGHTASRDEYVTNTTGGNYEDTHFGRACWVPPTMLPYSHTTDTNSDTQRKNRLKTQAAMYVNGYQKDWFGFNKGAVIGSFDGVTWFAIGKGRIVTATSKKLFLAINAPFGDLAENTIHTVGVSEYNPPATAALYDYDPTIPDGSLQNEAASCQKYHQCNVDSDCVTQLGWEYVCADVSRTSMYKPIFSSNANEYDEVTPSARVSNGSKTVSFKKWIFQSTLPGSSSKRCVYRGAGSVCRKDYAGIKNDTGRRKLLTCAPNFYCADPDSEVFNTQVVRYIGPLGGLPLGDGNLYGMDADILGRPLHYISNSSELSALPSEVQFNINANMALNSSSSAWGLCRPGKVLTTNHLDIQGGEGDYSSLATHQAEDSSMRTDYINQIGNCDSSFDTGWTPASFYDIDFDPTTWAGSADPAHAAIPPVHYNCPVFDTDGDYLYTKDVYTNLLESATTDDRLYALVEYNLKANRQNSCGLQSRDPGGSSPFTSIELGELNSTQITTPAFAKNACMRRAGSVCHTNLDCSPNKYHANLVTFFSPDYFGNDAELSYWEEYLVCGQGELVPQLVENDPTRNNDRFDLYDLTKNRCCRELGKEITIYSEDMLDFSFTQNADATDKTFSTTKFGFEYPSDTARYSRLASVNMQEASVSAGELISNGLSARTVDSTADNDGLISLIEKYQWRTLSDSASNTCCGGGWVRKFADGTNDWTRNDRFNINVSNFRCLNYQSPVIFNSDPSSTFGLAAGYNYIDNNTRDGEYNMFCQDDIAADESNAGCAQVSFDSAGSGFASSAPVLDTTNQRVDVIFGATFDRAVFDFSAAAGSHFYPYNAIPIQSIDYFSGQYGVDANDQWEAIGFQLPAYIPADFTATNFNLEIVNASGGNEMTCTPRAGTSIIFGQNFNPSSVGDAGCDGAAGICHYCYYPDSGVLAVRHDPGTPGGGPIAGTDYFVKVSFSAPGTQHYQLNNNAGYAGRSQKPGNMYFYLKRLGKFELTGIPQMYYEPLYCSDDYTSVVPGLYASSITDAASFAGHSSAITLPNNAVDTRLDTPNSRSGTPIVSAATTTIDNGSVVTKDGLDHPEIFSGHEFKCCIKIGRNTTGAGYCCSNFAAADNTDLDGDGDVTETICKLPKGTDLSVYFNRFVSGEGIADNLPGGGFSETDFDPNTGEPLMNSTVYNKLITIGDAYCENEKTRRGAAFGTYSGEPKSFSGTGGSSGGAAQSGKFGIVDSVSDFDDGSGGSGQPKGYDLFTQGYRWNHHVYCDDAGGGN